MFNKKLFGKHSIQKVFKTFNDNTGSLYTINTDRDSLLRIYY